MSKYKRLTINEGSILISKENYEHYRLHLDSFNFSASLSLRKEDLKSLYSIISNQLKEDNLIHCDHPFNSLAMKTDAENGVIIIQRIYCTKCKKELNKK